MRNEQFTRIVETSPLFRLGNRVWLILLLGILFSVTYWGSAALAWREPFVLRPTFLDDRISWQPDAIWFYVSQYALLFCALWLPKDLDRAHAALAMMLVLGVGGIAFLLFPAIVPRSDVPASGLTGLAWRLLYAIDTPANAIPSLHAALSVPAAVALWRTAPRWRVGGLLWLTVVLWSALATKQHFVPDLTAGVCLGLVCHTLVALHSRVIAA